MNVLIDFDGTIAPCDPVDLLLERFADPSWRTIEEEWKSGKIGSRQCMARQIGLVRASEKEMDVFAANIEIDPGFPEFVKFCRQRNYSAIVISDGLDRIISAVLNRHDINIGFRANKLQYCGNNRWELSFPHTRNNCHVSLGNCKCQYTKVPSVVVGDGRSDFCVSSWANLVLAKSSLVKYCVDNDIQHLPFKDFKEATYLLSNWKF